MILNYEVISTTDFNNQHLKYENDTHPVFNHHFAVFCI
jgi:hypothetical protein